MISRQIPAEIMSIPDRVWGRLEWRQLGLLLLPVGLLVIGFFAVPPAGNLSWFKAVLAGLVSLPPIVLAVRFENHLGLEWAQRLWRYQRRQRQPVLVPSSHWRLDNELVVIKDGDYRLVLETEGLSLDLMTEDEQADIFGLYESLLNSLGQPWQIVVRLRRLDPKDYLQTWREMYGQTGLSEAQKNYCRFVTDLVDRHQVVSRHFYIVLSCQLDQPDHRLANWRLQGQAQLVKQGLARLGLGATVLREADLGNWLEKEWVRERADHLIKSSGLERILTISGYPLLAKSGWLNDLINSHFNLDISYQLALVPPELALAKLNRKITELESQSQEAKRQGRLPEVETEQALKSALKLQDEIQGARQNLIKLSVYVRLEAQNLASLDKLTNQLVASLKGQLVSLKVMRYQQLAGLQATGLGAKPGELARRNFDSASASLGLPFLGQSTTDTKGVLYGVNELNNSLVLVDRFSLPNANSLIFAQSGAGKSYTAKLEIARSLLQGIEVTVLDPEGEYRQLAAHLGGVVVDLGSSGNSLNPLDILQWREAGQACLDLVALLGLLAEELSLSEKAVLTNLVAELRPGSRLGDLWQQLAVNPQSRELAQRLEKFVTGPLGNLFNQPTELDLNAPLVVFDLSQLSSQLRPALMMLVSLYLEGQLQSSNQRRLLVVDEAWLLMQTPTADMLAGLVRRARKRNLGVTLISQQATDFLSQAAGQAIVAQSCLRFFLRQDTTSLKTLSRHFGLSDYERRFLSVAQPGQALLQTGNGRLLVRLLASAEEHDLMTTGGI